MIKQVKNNNNNFLLQGSILAIAGLIVRFIGLLYRYPMISIIGTVGNGYYSSAYNIYSFFLILSSYSFPTAISKIISEYLANDRYLDIKKIIKFSFFIAFLVGVISFSIMFFGSKVISIIVQKEKVTFALHALAPTLFIMAFLSVLRGIFQGMGNMVPTAISQIIEQIVNAIFSVIFAYILFQRGVIANKIYEEINYEYAFGAAGGAIGTGIGAFFALLSLLFLYFISFKRYKRFFNNNNGYKTLSINKILFQFMSVVIPIIFSTTLYNISSIIDDIIFSNCYTMLGQKENIVNIWGIYNEFHLLFNIPVAVASALSASIIPSISTSVAENDVRGVVLKIKYSIKFTTLLVLPAFVGFIILGRPICIFLFNGEHVELLINILKFGSFSIITYSLSTISISILHGLGYFYKPLIHSIIALFIHIITIFILMLVFNLGIYAVVFSNIVFSLLVYFLNVNFLNKIVRYKKNYIKNIVIPFICSIIMGVIISVLYNFLNFGFLASENSLVLFIKLIICIFVGIFIYCFSLVFLRVLTKRDCEYIPFIKIFFNFLGK